MSHLLDPAAHADNWLWALCVLLAAVVVGAVLPIVPTGAAVSAMAALAHHRSWLSLGEVVVIGAGAAYLGDLVLYAVLLRGTRTRLGRWLHRRVHRDALPGGGTRADDRALHALDDHLDDLGDRLAHHDVGTLTTSRLLPGARIPVMAAAAATRYPLLRFAAANVLPVACWSVAYAGIGLAGRSVSDRPWVGALVAVAFGVLASALVGLVRRRRAR